MIKTLLNMKISPFIKLTEHGAAAVIQLDRPKALNAVNHEMFQQIHQLFRGLEQEKEIVIFKGSGKVFCAGGDVKAITTRTHEQVKEAYRNSSRNVVLLANYKIPYVALVDGLAMGGAAIYSIPGKYRVVTERTSFSMPETAIGYFNDAGASYFLSRLDNNFGLYLGMTGTRITGFNMNKVGLANHFVESSKLDDLEKELIVCKTHDEVQRTLHSFSSEPPTTETSLDEFLPRIHKCFCGATVEEIFINLQQDGSDWAIQTLKTLYKMSPTSLKVTLRSIRQGKNLSLRECLKMEFRLVCHHITDSDLKEGCRAILIDKDFKPKWNPSTIGEVTDDHVARFFGPSPDGDELTFDDQEAKVKL